MKIGQRLLMLGFLILILISLLIITIPEIATLRVATPEEPSVATINDATSNETIEITTEIIEEISEEEVDIEIEENEIPIVKETTTSISNKRVYISNNNSNVATSNDVTSSSYTSSQFKRMGVINWGGYRWTWYSQKVLPGNGLNIPGRHIDSSNFVCDENGYIVLASKNLSTGTIIDTPFGRLGKIYDYCPTSGTIDVYTNY
jgi:hypothetical protein